VSYAEPDQFRRRAVQATETKLSESELEDLLEQASRLFDLLCGKPVGYFEPVASGAVASNRTFYGDGGNFLQLDPYVPGSLNATLTFPDGYTAPDYIERDGYLVLTGSTGIVARYDPTYAGWYQGVPIVVSAKWGFSEVPADVKLAVIELAINLWRETDPAEIKLINIEGQPLREKVPPRVNEVAKRYRIAGRAFV
jgi:hypothetical protein